MKIETRIVAVSAESKELLRKERARLMEKNGYKKRKVKMILRFSL